MAKTLISAISKNYATALMDVASEDNSYDKFEIQLGEIYDVLCSSKDLQIVMTNSSISTEKKIQILSEIFGGKIEKKLINFLKILVEKNRFNEFAAIKKSFSDMVQKLSNKKTVEITSPIKLNFENKTNVLFKLEHKFNCEILPVWKVDKSLIAGLTFKYDDCVIDTSFRAKLENLSKNINR